MSDTLPLLIANAGSDDPACLAVLDGLRLPALQGLLAALPAPQRAPLPDDALDTPLERAEAELRGLAPGPGGIPWGAWHAARHGLATGTDQAWAVATPCHWEIGAGQVTLQDPAALRLTRAEADALAAAMAPYLAEDGLALHLLLPGTWLACGAPLRGLACASPARVQGEDLREHLPANPLLRRLQTEMQMLLYHHPVNSAREAQRQPVVNALWFSGAGPLPATAGAPPPEPQHVDTLTESAQRQDWHAWAQAWQRVDAEHCAPLLQRVRAGAAADLVLCGERASTRLAGAPRGTWSRLAAGWRTPALRTVLGAL